MFRPALGRDISSVTFGNAAADAQTDAGAFIFLLGVQSLEWLENPIEVFFIEADAIILYKNLADDCRAGPAFLAGVCFQ